MSNFNWMIDDGENKSIQSINWELFVNYATELRRRQCENASTPTCELSAEFHEGGVNLVRRLDFEDGTRWVVRIPQKKNDPLLASRLECEISTMAAVQRYSDVPVPKVHAFSLDGNNPMEMPFIVMDFIPGGTAMDAFGGYDSHRGITPYRFKTKYHTQMADMQVRIATVRFPMIGAIQKSSDGTFSVGPLPGVGGPFATAAEFFDAWSSNMKYPFRDETVRERTPQQVVDAILMSIKEFPSRLRHLAVRFPFRPGPFPLIHTDLYKSNVIIDDQYNVLSIIDWENAFVAPWEMVELIKDLSVVPSAMDGPFFQDSDERQNVLADRQEYVGFVKEAEKQHSTDGKLSGVFQDTSAQNLAHIMWLFEDGKIGFYGDVVDEIEKNV